MNTSASIAKSLFRFSSGWWPIPASRNARAAAGKNCASSSLASRARDPKEASLVNLADPSKLGDMEDPKTMACWAKEMGKSLGDETGEDLGDFDEMMKKPPEGEDGDEQ